MGESPITPTLAALRGLFFICYYHGQEVPFMRVPKVTYTAVDLIALVNTLEPDRMVKPVVVDQTRRRKFIESPLRPGQEYPWVKK